MIRAFAALAAVSLLAGCALTEDVATVKYVPTQADVVADAQPVGLTIVDGRATDRNRISAKRNSLGMEMAAIRSDREVPDVVRDALKTEFEERGFHVDAKGQPVTVTVNRFYNDYIDGAVGEVKLSVAITNNAGASIYAQNYTGGSKKTVFLANGSNAAESIATALKDAVSQMFADKAFVAAITHKAVAGTQEGTRGGASSPVSR